MTSIKNEPLIIFDVDFMDHLHWRSLQSETIGDSDMQQSLLYLPWPPWAM
jgi:hypothetical protein